MRPLLFFACQACCGPPRFSLELFSPGKDSIKVTRNLPTPLSFLASPFDSPRAGHAASNLKSAPVEEMAEMASSH